MNATIPIEISHMGVADTGVLDGAPICPGFDAAGHDSEWTP